MIDHAGTIRRVLESISPSGISGTEGPAALAALDALVAENQRLRDALADIATTAESDWAKSLATGTVASVLGGQGALRFGRDAVSLPLPLPVEPEHLIVVEIVDECADQTVVHQPAILSSKVRGTRFDEYDFPPATWPSACGQVKSGGVYVRSGPFEKTPVCVACEETE